MRRAARVGGTLLVAALLAGFVPAFGGQASGQTHCCRLEIKEEQTGSSALLFGLSFAGRHKGFAVGEKGTILVKDHAGAPWKRSSSGTDRTLYSVEAIDQLRGFAVGEAGLILITGDGGQTWRPVSSGTENTLYSTDFTAGVARAGGDYGVILRSDDLGATWRPEADDPALGIISAMSFPTARHGYAADQHTALISASRDGQNWAPLKRFSHDIFGLSFASPKVGVGVGQNGAVITTPDAGASWRVKKIRPMATLWDVEFGEISNLLAVGTGLVAAAGEDRRQSPLIFHSADEGSSWKTKSVALGSSSLNAVDFASPTTAYAAGDEGKIVQISLLQLISSGSSAGRTAEPRPGPSARIYIGGGLAAAAGVLIGIQFTRRRAARSSRRGE